MGALRLGRYERKLEHALAVGEHVVAHLEPDGAAAMLTAPAPTRVGMAPLERLDTLVGQTRVAYTTAAARFPNDGEILVLTNRRLLLVKDDRAKATVRAGFRFDEIARIRAAAKGGRHALVIEFSDGSTVIRSERKRHQADAFVAAYCSRTRRPQDEPGWVDPAFRNL